MIVSGLLLSKHNSHTATCRELGRKSLKFVNLSKTKQNCYRCRRQISITVLDPGDDVSAAEALCEMNNYCVGKVLNPSESRVNDKAVGRTLCCVFNVCL